eukprot:TRINITY_DN18965_c0_g1_i1.p1 TRINITY_DN18965_c0_g1~~TRINITY_DN18965_c0_g1_i1.p1  ORF type:complete len:366 (+),score=43.27 TRINITY_DN18965_c0_g1_i1:101-1099(+)
MASSSPSSVDTMPPKDNTPPEDILIQGVHCLYNPPPGEEHEFDVVLVPGLKAGAGEGLWWKTWTVRGGGEPGECWAHTWLPKKFPTARVLALSYGSGAAASAPLAFWESAINCLNSMVVRDVGLGRRPYIIVAHSVGGLVAKEILLRANTGVYAEEVGSNCKGLAFYGVPHLGTEAGDLESLFGVMFRQGALNNELVSLGEKCYQRNINFKALEPRYPLYHFVETLGTEVGGEKVLVVPPSVAAHNASADIMARIEADHFDVCRPFRNTDWNFAFLINFISAQTQIVPKTDPPRSPLQKGVGNKIGIAGVEGTTGRVAATRESKGKGAADAI